MAGWLLLAFAGQDVHDRAGFCSLSDTSRLATKCSAEMTDSAGLIVLDFRALMDAAPDGIAVVDEQGRMLVVNDKFCDLFGYESGELLNQRIRMLIPERLREVHAGHRARYFESPAKRPMGLGLQL